MLKITKTLCLPLSEIEFTQIRAQGAGGQHVNKVSTAIHLRFNIEQSTLPEAYKARLLVLRDYRITVEGIIIIKAQRYKSLEQNRADALQRLVEIIKKGGIEPVNRKKTKPSKRSIKKRLDTKKHRANLKKQRQYSE